MTPKVKQASEKLLIPLVISGMVFGVFYFGGDAYKSFGLAAVDSTTNVLKYLLGVVAFCSLGILANRFIRYVVFEGIIATTTGTPVPKLLTQLSSLLIFFITIAACASVVFNQDLTILWAASGVAGLVLGMALRELLQDVFAGIALNIDRSVRIGDFVQIHRAGDDKILGQLMEVSWRSTHVRDTYGDLISFPNSKFSSYTITNFSMSEKSGRTTVVTIDGRVPAARAMRILQSAALDAMLELNLEISALPTVGVKTIKSDGIEYIINYQADWQHLTEITWKVQQAVMLHLAKAGLKPAGHKSGDNIAADDAFGIPDRNCLLALLHATPIFTDIVPEALDVILNTSQFRFFQPTNVVVQSGEAGNELYLLLEGLLRTDGRIIGGRRSLAHILRPGDIFDCHASLLGSVHRTTIRSETPSLIYEISAAGLHALFEKQPDALHIMARNLARMDAGTQNIDEEKLNQLIAQMRHMFPPRTNVISISKPKEEASA